jgi:hypothetical protein
VNTSGSNAVECREPFVLKVGIILIFIYLAIRIINNDLVGGDNNTLSWILWAFFLIYSQIFSPDIIVYEEGLVILVLWKKVFVDWDKVSSVNTSSVAANVFILSSELDFLSRLLLDYPIKITTSRSNYKEAMKIIKEKIGERFRVG